MYGYVGDLPNATWVCALDRYLEEHGSTLLKEFVEEGSVNKSPALMKELAALPTSEDPAVKGMLENLITLIEKSQGVVICTNEVDIDARYLYDTQGYVGNLGSGSDIALLNEYLEKHGGDLIKEFVKNGSVKKSAKLMKEFETLQVPENPDIRYMIDNLVLLVKKSRKVITIIDRFDADKGEEPNDTSIPSLI